MKRTSLFLSAFLAALLSLVALGIGAAVAVDSPRTLMSRVDYDVARHAIAADSRRALARCRSEAAGERALCKAQARAEERVKEADLLARYYGTVSAVRDAQLARVKAGFDLARARCDSRPGHERTECLRNAREDRARALAAARQATT